VPDCQYPPVGTRVRWTSQAGGHTKTKEGVVRWLARHHARNCAFSLFENWPRVGPIYDAIALVVEVDTVNGQPRRSGPRYYRPRAPWLEVVS
jgi:hypothetical protein